jgi:hypothetical protein
MCSLSSLGDRPIPASTVCRSNWDVNWAEAELWGGVSCEKVASLWDRNAGKREWDICVDDVDRITWEDRGDEQTKSQLLRQRLPKPIQPPGMRHNVI